MKFNKFLITLFPVFLALPDIALNTGIINLRIDDLIIYLLLLINFKKIISTAPGVFIKTQYYLMFYVTFSLLLTLYFKPELISNYEIIRTFASLPYLLVLSFLYQNTKYRNSIFNGALIGGLIYVFSLIINYNNIMIVATQMEKYSSFKQEVAFATLNPNSIAIIASILGWNCILGFTENKKKIVLLTGGLLLIIPFVVLSRGTSIGLLVSGLILVIYQIKKFKTYVYVFCATILSYFLIKQFVGIELLKSATNIDVRSGEGFSGRYELWRQGFQLWLKSPIFGHGFSTENRLFIKYYNGHMAHQILLHYAIELGAIVLFIFLRSIYTVIKQKIKLFTTTNNLFFLLQVLIFISFFLADMSAQLLYFNKYAFIIYSMT